MGVKSKLEKIIEESNVNNITLPTKEQYISEMISEKLDQFHFDMNELLIEHGLKLELSVQITPIKSLK